MPFKLVMGLSLHLHPGTLYPAQLPAPSPKGPWSSLYFLHSRVPPGRHCHWLGKKTSGLRPLAYDPNSQTLPEKGHLEARIVFSPGQEFPSSLSWKGPGRGSLGCPGPEHHQHLPPKKLGGLNMRTCPQHPRQAERDCLCRALPGAGFAHSQEPLSPGQS